VSFDGLKSTARRAKRKQKRLHPTPPVVRKNVIGVESTADGVFFRSPATQEKVTLEIIIKLNQLSFDLWIFNDNLHNISVFKTFP
jgi:hypothetical protein